MQVRPPVQHPLHLPRKISQLHVQIRGVSVHIWPPPQVSQSALQLQVYTVTLGASHILSSRYTGQKWDDEAAAATAGTALFGAFRLVYSLDAALQRKGRQQLRATSLIERLRHQIARLPLHTPQNTQHSESKGQQVEHDMRHCGMGCSLS